MEQQPGLEILSNENAIYDALVDTQVAAVRPDIAERKAEVYTQQRGRKDDYTSMGFDVTEDRMRFDLEVWFPVVEDLRKQGVVQGVAEMRTLAHQMVGKTPDEFMAWFMEQTIATRKRLADLQDNQ